MMGRIGRHGTKSAWAEEPPSRTRRFVTNIRVAPAAKEGESEDTSYILLARSRYEHSQYSFMTAMRNDLLRRRENRDHPLRRREIIPRKTGHGMPHLRVLVCGMYIITPSKKTV